MNLMLEATRQEVTHSHALGKNTLYVRTLKLGPAGERLFNYSLHDDLDNIVQDIRQTHVTDRTTIPQLTFIEVKAKFDRAMLLDNNKEQVIHKFYDQIQILFDKIASEYFSAFMRILCLSKLMKNPNNYEGKDPKAGIL